LSLCATGFHALVEVLGGIPSGFQNVGAGLVERGSRHVFVCLFWLSILFSLYPAHYFLRVLEDTAAGNDEVKWEYEVWYDCIGQFLLLLWLGGCCAAVAGGVVGVLSLAFHPPVVVRLVAMLVLTLLLFPIVVVSVLVSGSKFVLVDPQVLVRALARPDVLGVVYLDSALFALPCVLLGYWVIWGYHLWAAPITGLVWAMYWLSYGRVLGRAAWVLGQADTRRSGKRKRRLPKAEEETAV
jgi:hypothetical protein